MSKELHSEDLEQRTAQLKQAIAELAKANAELTSARDELQRANERFSIIADWIPVPIAIASKATGRVLYANDHFAAVYGLSSGNDLLDREMTDFFFDRADRAAMVDILEKQGYLSNREIRYKKADGTPIWVAAYFRYVIYDGEPAVFGALLDISERKKHSEELEQRVKERTAELEVERDKALAADRMKDAFLANMSHELRTPLGHILGFCELQMRKAAAQQGQEQLIRDLSKIESSGKHLLNVINDILDYASIAAGKMPLTPEEVDVAALLNDVIRCMEADLQRNNNKMQVDVAQGVGSLHVDRTRMRQILTNLLGNACKFTDKGTISVSVARERSDSRDWVVFGVSDTGLGMTEEELERIFKPFEQGSSSITIKYHGTGLGLVLTRGLCRLMGGEVTAQSAGRQKGSQFVVRLPAPARAEVVAPKTKVAEPGSRFESRPPARQPVSSNTVLVIDDEEPARDLMRRFLEKEGFQVYTACNGEEGFQVAKERRPAAITLDALMPGMSGWAVLAALKAEDTTAHIPVIMVTIVDDKTRGFALGASEFITKPFDWDRLTAILRKYCGEPPSPPILVVDDDVESQELLRGRLQEGGWQVVVAANGRLALQRLAEGTPALILLDLIMPEMDGFEFLEKLRSHEAWQTIPVVVITAKELSQEDWDLLNGHINKVLRKGTFSQDDLQKEIQRWTTQSVRRQNQVVGGN